MAGRQDGSARRGGDAARGGEQQRRHRAPQRFLLRPALLLEGASVVGVYVQRVCASASSTPA